MTSFELAQYYNEIIFSIKKIKKSEKYFFAWTPVVQAVIIQYWCNFSKDEG